MDSKNPFNDNAAMNLGYVDMPPQYPPPANHNQTRDGSPHQSFDSFNSSPSQGVSPVPLSQLRVEEQWIDCPSCKNRTRTRIQARSKGMKQFMNVFWWPLPGRKDWWSTVRWFCASCNAELASQKDRKDLQVHIQE
jgi:hypothetical protein